MAVETQKKAAEDIILDFSGLFSNDNAQNTAKKPLETHLGCDNEKAQENTENATQSENSGNPCNIQAFDLLQEYRKAKEEGRRALEIYQERQQNIKVSEQLRREIMQGMAKGEDPRELFLKAAEVISLMTGDKVISRKAERLYSRPELLKVGNS